MAAEQVQRLGPQRAERLQRGAPDGPALPLERVGPLQRLRRPARGDEVRDVSDAVPRGAERLLLGAGAQLERRGGALVSPRAVRAWASSDPARNAE